MKWLSFQPLAHRRMSIRGFARAELKSEVQRVVVLR